MMHIRHSRRRLLAVLLVVLPLALGPASPSIARARAAQSSISCPTTGTSSAPVSLDGQFGDWIGRACISDPVGDCGNADIDLTALYLASSSNDPTAYFMLARQGGGNQPIGIRIYIDTNNNGGYQDARDRIVVVRYQPAQQDSQVDVELHDAADAFMAQIASDVNWGQSLAAGAQQVELGVSFAQLGILAGQAIRLRAEGLPGNFNGSPCDSTSEVQWSPADALGRALLVALLIGAGGWMAYQRRRPV